MTDRERIRRIQSGEPEQMNELIETYYQEIFQYCYSRTGRESAAYDCAQETFLRVIRYLNRYVEQKKFRAYLFGIARSVCIDFFRKKAEAELGYEDGYEERLREEDFADQVSEQVMLQKAMQCLKPEQREVLDLSYFHGLKAREIAYVTGEKTANREEQDPPGTEKSEKLFWKRRDTDGTDKRSREGFCDNRKNRSRKGKHLKRARRRWQKS